MKKLWKMLLLTGILAVLMCVTAYAADGGAYDVTGVTPQDADGTAITAVSKDGMADFYEGAERFELTYTGAAKGSYYLVYALDDGTNTPTASNIVYIDQKTAEGDSVTFDVYPSKLAAGKTYKIFVTSNDGKASGLEAVASFKYYQAYTLGDVDSDGYWTANDALYALQIAVNRTAIKIDGVDVTVSDSMKLAADTDKDSYVTANDALLILQKAVGKDVF